jgi:alanine racemase
VVKANGYGHGAAACAAAALRGGATRLAVAAAAEAEELRLHFPETPVLVMGALSEGELRAALAARADVAVWRDGFREVCSRIAAEFGRMARVHVKLDSGMGRLGERDPTALIELARACDADQRLDLVGLWTHFATADEEGDSFMAEQLATFSPVADAVRELAPDLTVHAANSAATIRDQATHFDMVRCGIAVYGLDPFHRDPAEHGLEPALELHSYVADVKRFERGASAGYGRTWRAPEDTWVGVLPIGYGDGVRRGLSNNGEVLVGGRRYPLVGTVSMDNITIDLGPETDVEPGAPAVLIGPQGSERILAEEVAAHLDTINYEVTCGISQRVPREVHE